MKEKDQNPEKIRIQNECIDIFNLYFQKNVVESLIQKLIFIILPENCCQINYNEESCID